MKRFFVRCAGQFLCVLGLTSFVSDVDADSYSCSISGSPQYWYVGWATTGVSIIPWNSLYLEYGTSFMISGTSYAFSTLAVVNYGQLPSYKYATWDLCALPTDGYTYPISGGYQIRPGCATRDGALYSPKADVFEHYDCMFVDSPRGCTGITGTAGTGSGSSGIAAYTPPCCYMSTSQISGISTSVHSISNSTVEVLRMESVAVTCTFNGCKAGEYYNTRDNTYSTITYRTEPGTFTYSAENLSDNILGSILIEGVGVNGALGYRYCTTRGCRESSHFNKRSKVDFYDLSRCGGCNYRYSINDINSPLNGNYTATLNWTTPAAGTGEGTCRLSSYQWTDDKGVRRIPCNNATSQ